MPPPWRKIKFDRLAALLLRVRPPLRWRWYKNAGPHGSRLQVVSPRGVHWDFTLCGGAWIRPTLSERSPSTVSVDAQRTVSERSPSTNHLGR